MTLNIRSRFTDDKTWSGKYFFGTKKMSACDESLENVLDTHSALTNVYLRHQPRRSPADSLS